MAGLGDKIVGKAEELKGKVTGDEVEELKGKARQATGELKDKLNRAVVHAEDALDERRHEEERRREDEPAQPTPYE